MDNKIEFENHMEYSSDEKHASVKSMDYVDVEAKLGTHTLTDADFSVETMDPVEARRIMRKIDFRIIPLLSLLYL